MAFTLVCSIRSSGRVWGSKKHEIYVAAFGSHLFMTYLYRTGGGHGTPLDPLLVWCVAMAMVLVLTLSHTH